MYEACEDLAGSFLEFWQDHSALMAVIDLAVLEATSASGVPDPAAVQLHVAATEVITDQQRAGVVPADLDPMATAVVFVSMLADVAVTRTASWTWGGTRPAPSGHGPADLQRGHRAHDADLRRRARY